MIRYAVCEFNFCPDFGKENSRVSILFQNKEDAENYCKQAIYDHWCNVLKMNDDHWIHNGYCRWVKEDLIKLGFNVRGTKDDLDYFIRNITQDNSYEYYRVAYVKEILEI
jgi:hypothetical protein